MTKSTEISGKPFRVNCADALAAQAEWVLGLLSTIEKQRGAGFLKDGVMLRVGWSNLLIREKNGEYVVCEPNFGGNPLHEWHDDLTCMLSVQADQNAMLSRTKVKGTPVSFNDKVVYAKGSLTETSVMAERKPPSPGDSGWYVGPVDDAEEELEYEAAFVYQFLRLRPALLKIMTLPPGFLVVFDGDNIEGIVDEKNQEVAF